MKNSINTKSHRVLSLTQLLSRKQKKTKTKGNKTTITSGANTALGKNTTTSTLNPSVLPSINVKNRNFSLGTNLLPSTDIRSPKSQKPIKPLIPAKSLTILLKDKPEKTFYNRRLIDYKNTGLLQFYIGIGGKLLPRRQTRLSAKQQRFVAKTVKSARVMGLLPFVSKERGFYR